LESGDSPIFEFQREDLPKKRRDIAETPFHFLGDRKCRRWQMTGDLIRLGAARKAAEMAGTVTGLESAFKRFPRGSATVIPLGRKQGEREPSWFKSLSVSIEERRASRGFTFGPLAGAIRLVIRPDLAILHGSFPKRRKASLWTRDPVRHCAGAIRFRGSFSLFPDTRTSRNTRASTHVRTLASLLLALLNRSPLIAR
jgi:hypothetical protein